MRFRGDLLLLLAVLLSAVPLLTQNVNLKHPEEFGVQKQVTAEEMRDRAASLQLQKDAKELSNLCASLPPDMEGIRVGVLTKDVLEKLKRIEKLSKRVREELTQATPAPAP
jgi:hypothetical protein